MKETSTGELRRPWGIELRRVDAVGFRAMTAGCDGARTPENQTLTEADLDHRIASLNAERLDRTFAVGRFPKAEKGS